MLCSGVHPYCAVVALVSLLATTQCTLTVGISGPNINLLINSNWTSGFSLPPGSSLLLSPGTSLGLSVVWDDEGDVNITGLVDGAMAVNPVNITQASISSQGNADFALHGASLSVGRHELNVTATLNGSQPITLTVEIFNQEPVGGLTVSGLDADHTLWTLVNNSVILQAHVTSGTDLKAEWRIGDTVVETQNVSSYNPSYSLTWDRVENLPITLIVSTEHNVVSANFTLRVVHSINGISLDKPIITSQANENVSFRLLYAPDMNTEMGDVNVTVEWGDGTTDLSAMLTTLPGSSHSLSHKYTTQGNLTIVVNLKTMLDSKVFVLPAYIWDKLENVSLAITPTSLSGKPGDVFNISLSNPPREGFQYVIDCGEGGSPLSNSESVWYSDYVAPVPASLTCSYTAEGNYQVRLTAFNGAYTVTSTLTVEIRKLVDGLTVMGLDADDTLWTLVNSSVSLQARVTSGTNLSAEWRIGDTVVEIQNVSSYNHILSYNGTWGSAEILPVTLIVSTERNSVSTNFTLRVVHPINGISLDRPSVTSQANENIDLLLLYAADMDIEMGHVTLTVDWGDGSTVLPSMLAIVPGSSFNLSHEYIAQGNLTIVVTLTTVLDTKIFVVPAYIWDKLENVSLAIAPTSLSGKPGDVFNISLSNPPREGFQYIIDCGEGGSPLSNSESVWYSDYVAPLPSSLTCSYTAAGDYQVRLTASNGAYTVTSTLTVEIRKFVDGLTVMGLDADDTLWTLVNSSVSLQARVTSGTNLSAEWRIGDTVVEIQNVSSYNQMLSYNGTWGSAEILPITLIVSTERNSVSTNFTLRVVHPINGISLDRPSVTSQANENVELRLLYAADMAIVMGNVTLTVDWGDSSTVLPSMLTIVPGSSLNLSHEYIAQGNLTIVVTLTTVLDTKMFVVPAYVWDKLENISLAIAPTTLSGKPGDVFNISLSNPPREGFQYIIDCGEGGSPLSNSESVWYSDYVAPLPSSLTCSYTATGYYQIRLTAFNGAYMVASTLTVEIQKLVDGLTVMGLDADDTLWTLVNSSVSLQARVTSGTNLSAEWRIGDTVVEIQDISSYNETLSYNVMWDRADILPITLIVSTELNTISSNFTLRVVHPINGISLDKPSITSQANKNVKLRLMYAADMDTDMGDMKLTVEWGDGTTDITGVLTIVPGSSHNLSHEYSTQGNLTINVTLETAADSKRFVVPAHIWDKLENVSLVITGTPTAQAGKPGDVFSISFSNPPREGFQYIIDCGEGGSPLSNSESVWYSDYVAPGSSYPTCSYTSTGEHQIHLTAFNGLYTATTSKIVIIENPLQAADFTMLLDYPVIPVPDGIIHGNVSVNDNVLTKGLCYWDFGIASGTTESNFLNMAVDFPQSESYVYSASNTYTITFNCGNNISQITLSSTVTAKDWSIEDFQVNVNNPQIMDGMVPEQDVLLSLTLLDFNRLPVGIIAEFNYSDSSPVLQTNLTLMDTYHRFPSRGLYNGAVSLYHQSKGQTTLDFQVRQGAFQISQNFKEGQVRTQSFEFTVDTPGPFSGYFTVNYDDGSNPCTKYVNRQAPSDSTCTHSYDTVNIFTASLTGVFTYDGNTYTERVDFEPIETKSVLFGFAPTSNKTYLVSPTTSINISVVWEEDKGEMTVNSIKATTISTTQASATNQGSAVLVVKGSDFDIGRQELWVEATLRFWKWSQRKWEWKLFQLSTDLAVDIFNQEPVDGLTVNGLDADHTLWTLVNSSVSLQAQVTSGTDLRAEWRIGDTVMETQVYSLYDRSLSYNVMWTKVESVLVTLVVSTQHNAVSTNFTLRVVHPINGISLDRTSVTSQANENAELRLLYAADMATDMGELNVTLEWGDGSNASFNDVDIIPTSSLDMAHVYTTQGNLSITVKLKTPADSAVFVVPAIIWDKLYVSLNITPESQAGKPGDIFYVNFSDPPAEGFQYIIDCGVDQPLFNDESVWYSDYIDPMGSLHCSYANTGVYLVSLKAFNGRYLKITSETVIVENPLYAEAFSVNLDYSVVPVPDGTVQANVTVAQNLSTTGWCRWGFGTAYDGTFSSFLSMPLDFPRYSDFIYNDPGVYTVSFYCRNNISEMTVTSDVTARHWEITDFQVFVIYPLVFDGSIPYSDVILDLTLLDIQRPPTNLTVRFVFGDNIEKGPDEVIQWRMTYRFPVRDLYSSIAYFSHPQKGNSSVPFRVRQGAFQIDVNVLDGLVETQPFVFAIEVPMNFTGNLEVDFGDGSATWNEVVSEQTSTSYSVTHFYQTVDNFTAKLLGMSTQIGNTYTEKVDFPGPIMTDGPVSDLVLSLDPVLIDFPPGITNATMKLDRTQHRIRRVECWIDFNEILDPFLRSWNGSLSPQDSFAINFEYITLGAKTVTFNCSNPYSYQLLIALPIVTNPCFSPDAIFDRQYGVYTNPQHVLQSKALRLVTRTVILCPMSLPDFEWTLWDFNRNGVVGDEHTDLHQPHTDFYEFPRGYLDHGLYRMALNISFGADQNYTWLLEYTFVNVIETPLEAYIAGGAFRLTGDRSALIDGYTLSYDPVWGLDNKTGLAYDWECHTFSTAYLEELINVTSVLPAVNGTIPCDDISTRYFTGNMTLKIPVDVENRGYLFKLWVRRGLSVSAPTSVAVQFREKSLTISLICVVNCGRKVAVTSVMTLTIQCDNCDDGDMLDADYTWDVSIFDNSSVTYNPLPDPQSLFLRSGHDSGQAIVIAAHSLQPCRRYRVMGSMALGGREDAVAGIEFLTNCPPWGGQCDVIPRTGNVMRERFLLECVGWQDDGFVDPTHTEELDGPEREIDEVAMSLYYIFSLRKNGIIVPIAEGGESSMPRISLPLIPGQEGEDYELVARIYDTLNEYTEVIVNVTLDSTISNVSASFDTTDLAADAEDNVEANNTNIIQFWKRQANYSGRSSTLNKELRGLTTVSSLLATYVTIPENNLTDIEQAAENEDESPVVTADWSTLWQQLNDPIVINKAKQELTVLTENFTRHVYARRNETEGLTGQGIAALGEGMATILYNPAVTDDQSIFDGSDVAESGTVALRKLASTTRYPIEVNFTEAVFSMMALVDRVVESSLPTYDLSVGQGLLFNGSGMEEDASRFMISRFMVAQALKEKQKINTTQSVMPRLARSVNTMLDSLLSGVVLGQPNQQVRRGQLTLAAGKVSGRTLGDTPFDAGTMRMQLDSINQDGTDSDRDASVDVRASVFNKNPMAWSSDGSSYEITSPVVTLNMTDKHGARKLRKLTLSLQRGQDTPVPTPEIFSTHDTRDGPDGWLFHRLTLRSASSAVVAQVTLPDGLTKVVAYLRSGRAPIKDRHDFKTEGKILEADQGRRKRAATSGSTFQIFVDPGSLSAGIVFIGLELPELPADHNETLQYSFMSFSDACRVWDETTSTWDATTCKVTAFSTPEETICICDNPPGMSFASSFFVAPNTIDFSTVFSKFDITNAAVYGTLIGLVAVWILAVVWARRKDKQDKQRWLVGYLKDNLVDDSYFYLLTVHTGMRKGAGTLSNVKFVLSGNRIDTGVRNLSDGIRTLDRGSVMTYVMTTTRPLGNLLFLRVWHDDTGLDDKGSWYLNRIEVEDLQQGERYNFICEKWLALDKEDGLIDRFLPVTVNSDVMTFDKLFSEHARVGITDSHMWFSCLMRPERSTFTRVQRVSCCLALLLLTMITSAMFYQPDVETGESTNTVGMEVQIGIMRFSMTTLWTSTVSIIITTIPLVIFTVLFRSYRPKAGPRAKAQTQPTKSLGSKDKMKMVMSKLMTKYNDDVDADKNVSDLLDSMLQQNPLPHAAVYGAWLLLIITMALSAFFLLLYSMQWGTAVSEQWLASFVLSFFESIFLMDPVKVLLIAVAMAYFTRNPYFSTHYQHVDMERVYSEADSFGKDEIDPTALPPDPVSEDVLEAARTKRKQEELAQSVFFELILQIFFVFCIFSVSYGNRDQKIYAVNKHLADLFYREAPLPFNEIKNRTDVTRYMKETLLPVAFPDKDIAGNELDWKRRLFASDFTSFRVGPVRVRQVRMPKEKKQPEVASKYPELKLHDETHPPYNMDKEETGAFCLRWRHGACSDEETRTKLSLDSWRYTADVLPVPIWGIFEFYPIGGYLADFAYNRDVVNTTMAELEENAWLDLQTRAVFVELSVYNPNVNLFTFIRMGTEFPEVGANVVWKVFKTIRIYNHLGAMGAYVFMCELIVAIIVVVFTVKVAKKLKSQRCAYFKDFWQVLDVWCLAASYVAIVFYILKWLSVQDVMDLWRQDPKVYVDFYLPVLWDEVYGYLLAALVFVVSLRMMRVLGYNKRVTMIAEVLARAGKPLLGFASVFFIIITAYAWAGIMLFNSMYEFRSVWETYCTLYVVLLGKNVLGRFIEEASLTEQIYFISLTVLVLFIMYTMFQAILCHTTSVVKTDIDNIPAPYGLTNVLTKFYRATVADWVPQWVVRSAKTDASDGKVPAPKPLPASTGKATLFNLKEGNRTQPHRVLATLSDHMTKFIPSEELQKKKKKKPRREFLDLSYLRGGHM